MPGALIQQDHERRRIHSCASHGWYDAPEQLCPHCVRAAVAHLQRALYTPDGQEHIAMAIVLLGYNPTAPVEMPVNARELGRALTAKGGAA